jgi:hypothetical protein
VTHTPRFGGPVSASKNPVPVSGNFDPWSPGPEFPFLARFRLVAVVVAFGTAEESLKAYECRLFIELRLLKKA